MAACDVVAFSPSTSIVFICFFKIDTTQTYDDVMSVMIVMLMILMVVCFLLTTNGKECWNPTTC